MNPHDSFGIGINEVYNTDALTLLKLLPDQSVDCIITDPPYGVGKADWDSEFPIDWIAEGWRVSKRMLVMPGMKALVYAGMEIGRYRDCISMFARNGMTRGGVGFGNWIPVLVCGEWQWEARQNHLSFTVTLEEKINHPSPKPLSAMLKLIEKYTESEWLICDPFLGSGTTAVAALRLGRRFIGSDINAEYCEEARQRIAQPYTVRMFES